MNLPASNLISSGNAKVFGLEKGLKLQGKEFNNLVTLFYVTYIVFDIPWVLAIKKFGVNRVLGVAMTGWSASTLGTGFTRNYHQALACRLLLGLFEAGLLPCMIFIISTIWDRKRQAKRVAVIYCATTISGAFGGLIAYAISTVGSLHGLEAWRWLFIIEGIISFIVGGMTFFGLPYSAERAWFLNQQQAELMVQKKQRDAAFKGDDHFKWKYLVAVASDPLVYLAAFSLFSSSLPLLGFGTFLPTIISGFGYVVSSFKLLSLLTPFHQIYFSSSELFDYSRLCCCHTLGGFCCIHVRSNRQTLNLSLYRSYPCPHWLCHCSWNIQSWCWILCNVPLWRRNLSL